MATFLRRKQAPADIQVAVIPQYQGGHGRRPRVVMGREELAYVSSGSVGQVIQHALSMTAPKGKKPTPGNWANKARKPGLCFDRTPEPQRAEDIGQMTHAFRKAQERKASVNQ